MKKFKIYVGEDQVEFKGYVWANDKTNALVEVLRILGSFWANKVSKILPE